MTVSFDSTVAMYGEVERWYTGKEVLVPLTQSLFVPGRLRATAPVLVDVGTGFYVGKTPEGAAEILAKQVSG